MDCFIVLCAMCRECCNPIPVSCLLGLLVMVCGYLTPAHADYLTGWQAVQEGRYADARKLWLPPASEGAVDLQFALGFLHETGRLGEDGNESARDWYERAVQKGVPGAMYRLAGLLLDADADVADRERSIRLLSDAAEAGFAPAQYRLGRMYLDGDVVAANPDLAVHWFQMAARNGIPEAQYALARVLMMEPGLHADALHWYRAAADAGLPEAQNNLGFMHENGLGVEKSDAEAARWYKRAAEGGLPIAATNLATMLSHGRGTARDLVEAARQFRIAAEGGDPYGQIGYAVALANGLGLDADLADAYAWLLVAATSDNADVHALAREHAERLIANLDKTTRQLGVKRARALRTRDFVRLSPGTCRSCGGPADSRF